MAPPLDAGYIMLWNTQKMYCGSTSFFPDQQEKKAAIHRLRSFSPNCANAYLLKACTTTVCTSFSRDNMTCNALERSITRSFLLCEAALEGLPALFNLC